MGWSLSDIGNAVSNRAQAARDALSHGVDAVTSTASSAARSVTTTVTRTATTVASTASDLGAAARDRAVDLGRAGMDLGRRGVDAVRDFDVREAAATARQGLSTATEAARDGITTATEWSSARVGDAADYARSHVTGDDLASRAFRGVVSGAESTTRFQLGVAGGITREVASTVGAVGQLAVTATEMQYSHEARVEYGTAIVNGVADAGRAAGDYVESVVDDPSRLAGDAQGAWNATGGFVGDTAARYGQAIREGRTEEIGMDVGTVATYVVPVGGGPARGALTAAVREGGEALVRGGGEALVRTSVREGGEASVRATAETALRTGPGVAERNGAALVQRITEAGGTAPLPQGAGRIADVAAASRVSGREVAVYRDGVTGTRQITLGNADSVTVPAGSRIVAHTQPGVGPAALTPSAADVTGLSRLGQGSSAIIDQAGNVARFRVDDVAAQGARAERGEMVRFEAPSTGRVALALSSDQIALNTERFADLATVRASRALPIAGASDDAATLARLDINGSTFYGVNRGAQQPITPITLERVNAQTRTHAEAEVVQQAINQAGRANGGRAEMWVDRAACDACGPNGGLRSLARNLGVDELIVHGPEGSFRYTPTK